MEQETDLGPAVEPRSLSDILGSQPDTAARAEPSAGQQAEPQAATTEQETGEAKAQRARDEAGRFAPEAQTAPPAEPNAPEEGRVAAIKAERQRRQQAEQRAADLERQLREFQQRQTAPAAPQAPAQPAAPAQPPADFWADPEGYVANLHKQTQAEVERRTSEVRFALAAEVVRSQHADYDEAESALHEHVQEAEASGDPMRKAQAEAIRAAIRNAPNPAAIALQLGRQAKMLREAGNDPQVMFQRAVEAEVAKRLAAQQPAPAPVPANPAPRLPTSLAGARAAAPRSASTYSGPRHLSSILGQQ
jgi:hypothetical protein